MVIDCRMINHSGIGTYVRSLVGTLCYEKRLRIVCLGQKSLFENLSWRDSIEVVEVNSPIFSVSEQLELPVKIPACDIFWSPQYNIPLLPIRAKKRVVTIHDVYHLAFFKTLGVAEKLYAKVMLNAAVRLSDAVITVSEFSKHEIGRFLHPESGKVEVIYNGCKPFSAQAENEGPAGRYVLFVGNVKPHKNLKRALEAFEDLVREMPELKFCIVGERDRLRTADDSLSNWVTKLGNTVIFTGAVDDATLAAYYRNAAMLLFPSYYEGFGLPLLEAMQFGIPIVASNAASIPEVGGDAVVYFDPFDAEEIAAAMRKIFDGSYRVPLEAYEKQLNRFTWEKSAGEHMELFERLLA